jgi:hypothetical protein
MVGDRAAAGRNDEFRRHNRRTAKPPLCPPLPPTLLEKHFRHVLASLSNLTLHNHTACLAPSSPHESGQENERKYDDISCERQNAAHRSRPAHPRQSPVRSITHDQFVPKAAFARRDNDLITV